MNVLHKIWRVLKPLIEVVVAVVVVLVLILIPTLNHSVGTIKNNLSGFNVQAAETTGPLTGDQSVIQTEIACIKSYAANPANNYVGYLPAFGAPEHTDNVRSGVQPCATFTGSFTGPNQVYQYNSETTYNQINLIVFDRPTRAICRPEGRARRPVGSSSRSSTPPLARRSGAPT